MIILCNGIKRSGSTLQYNLVKDILEFSGMTFENLGYKTLKEVQKEKQELLLKTKENKVYILKTHEFTFLNNCSGVKVITIYRNVKDIAASYKRFTNTSDSILLDNMKLNLDEFMKISLNSKCLLVQNYENLYFNRLEALEKILNFLSITIDNSLKIRIIEKNSTELQFNKQQNTKPNKIYLLISRFVNKFYLKNQESIDKLINKRIKSKIKNLLVKPNQESQLHFNHISSAKGKPNSYHNILNKFELENLKELEKAYNKFK